MKHVATTLVLLLAILAVGVQAGAQLAGRAPTGDAARSIDPKILGVWKRQGKNEYLHFHDDGRGYFGTADVPYTLEDAGYTLVINDISTYHRVGTSTGSIVGHWRDDPNGEELVYSADGRYVALEDGEVVGWFGSWTAAGGKLTGFEFRFTYETANGKLVAHPHRHFGETSQSYTLSNDDKKLTLDGTVYVRP